MSETPAYRKPDITGSSPGLTDRLRAWANLHDKMQGCTKTINLCRDSASEIERLRTALKRIAAVQYGLDMSEPTQDREAYWHDMAIAYRKTASEALKVKP